jgi:hypothetical protein
MNEAAKGVLGKAADALGLSGVGDEVQGEPRLYRQSALNGFENGCLLDLRVRIAMDLLKGPLFANVVAEGVEFPPMESSPGGIACHALDIASELLKQAEARGWVDPLPDDGGLNRAGRLQASRVGRFGAVQQMEAQKAMAEDQGRVSAVGPLGRTFNG